MAALQLPEGDAAAAGFSPRRLDRIADALTVEIESGRMPGAVVGIVRGGRLVHLRAHGFRDPVRRVALTADSLFWIASMTKPLTAVTALTLVERGRLLLEADIGDYLPQFANMRVADASLETSDAVLSRDAERQPTVLDLMRHTAGIVEGYLGNSRVHALYVDAVGNGMTDLTGQEFADRLSRLPLLFDPGSTWHYGFGMDLVGLMVESIVGKSLGDYMVEQLFGPLGMSDTSLGVPADKLDRYALPLPVDPFSGRAQALPDLSIARFHSGGAGLVSTASDYLRFIQMVLDRGAAGGGHVLGRKTVEFMTSDQLPRGTDVHRLEQPGWNPGHGFGLGVAVRTRVGGAGPGPGSVGEVTWPGSSGTFWWADPAEDLGVVFMTHTPSRAAHARYWPMIKALVLQALVA